METTTREFLKSLGQTIRKLRGEKGFSQEGFAAEVGLHRTYVGAIERGERNISAENLLRISAALDIELSKLITEAERYLETV